MDKPKYLLLPILFLTAFAERIFWDFGPNVELVTAAMVLSTFYLGGKTSLKLTLTIMLITDIILGNSGIFIFTWSGFAIPIYFISKMRNTKSSVFIRSFTGTLSGISSTAFFFVWTNFGVWLLSSIYPKTVLGLLASYVNALPFLRYQAISTLVFVPLGFIAIELAIAINKKWKFNKYFLALPRRQTV